MKKQRVFIAINLPDSIKKELLTFQREWANLPVRWTKKDNLHITLDFIGYVTDEELLEVIKSIKKKAQNQEVFEIKLNRICLGPLNRRPRMIWAVSEDFKYHITLARGVKGYPDVNREISLKFLVESIEVMASFLSRQGPDYTILESIKL